ncbi:phosphoribosylglycinamide formyltransferase [Corynebacterium sp. HMSC06D04]|uniref:Phosphoribosylglycinamide formyltransferase n=1 Tax=Corynebacterium simulans TaxID=146827 RepID=A0ABR5VCD2_9CORY|nr:MULTISPECIES: phosphoribosylglycinamide formyltransferase [Corynebacterium]AMO90981.1 phosphoribosylglycinamide formyltransferase [Corynebacterium simulans]KXU18495.1 phosphoribosylglycinamide formyltransferase [Corynebacterium simulans]MDK7139834.1 phosphoribosylglycinamide formyltransferase [Corynebacterium simulans]OFQ43926.1 phosphoribosylglycinamide formyltransferase [Corynebacterium sp. HMSC076D02]OFR40351.1 phosphoribosylglycinamide formyltransferase [Corynebacterium sp. HMSC077D03]
MTSQHQPQGETVRTSRPIEIVVLVSGTGSLLQAIIDAQDENYRVVKVVADVPCQGVERAKAAGIEAEVVEMGADRAEWNKRLVAAVEAAQPDVVVSAGFMKILGADFLARFEGRTINTHPALLPSFKGAHGVRDALEYGVKVTGSTVHFVDAGVDTGRIIAQEPVLVRQDDDEASLHERIKVVERQLIVKVLRAVQVAQDANATISIQL